MKAMGLCTAAVEFRVTVQNRSEATALELMVGHLLAVASLLF